MSTLPEFIAEIGDPAAADLFSVPVRTIASWRRRERTPRPAQAQQIVERTQGRVTFEGIFGPAPDPSSSQQEAA